MAFFLCFLFSSSDIVNNEMTEQNCPIENKHISNIAIFAKRNTKRFKYVNESTNVLIELEFQSRNECKKIYIEINVSNNMMIRM